ncbi:MAG TPA: murein biosynthesis integral membrane protein MurJ [Candidatus Woesebacteria bacterium]|nr:murein biosynthesis integral membrane protein MurJ [Candidatus Woesebacteria bacterium]
MNTLLKKTKDFIFAQQTSILTSTLILAGMIIISKGAGFIRYRILNDLFTTEELDIFYASFRIPDLVFEVLISGALSTTFIPFFIEYQKKSTEQNKIISSIINVVCLALVVFIIILIVLLPYLIPLITPGFSPEKNAEIITYSRLLLLGQLPFLVLGNFLTGISQAKKSFILPALAPIIYNLAIIAGTILLSDQMHLMAPIIGVMIGALLFFLLQLPILYFVKFEYKLIITHLQEAWRFFRTAIPRIMTIIVAQIDATIDLTLATLMGSGAFTIFYLAQHLQLLPVSIIGIAFGQASLPYLTDMYQDGKIKEFKKIIIESILNILFFTIPAAAFFIMARTPIVRLFYGGEKFSWDDTVLTALTLSYFSISVPLHSIYYFLTRCFYAIFDTKTPFFISLISIGLNAALSISFTLVFKLPVWALAISFSISMTLHVFLLFFLLNKKIKKLDIKLLLQESSKILIATSNSAVITYFIMRLLDGLIFDTTRTLNVFMLLATGSLIFATLYLFMSWLFGIKELYIITKMLLKVKEYKQKITELYKGVE